jgi:hypothetical protein
MDLREESLRLRELATHPPTQDARASVLQALTSKHEGIQAVAAEVLGAWGDPESKAALRTWFLGTLNLKSGWAIRSVGARELGRLTAPEDTTWILDLYFGTEDGLLQHELLKLAGALPASAKDAVNAKAKDRDPVVRRAAMKLLVNSSWGAPKDLLHPFASDPDPIVRKILIAWGVA